MTTYNLIWSGFKEAIYRIFISYISHLEEQEGGVYLSVLMADKLDVDTQKGY